MFLEKLFVRMKGEFLALQESYRLGNILRNATRAVQQPTSRSEAQCESLISLDASKSKKDEIEKEKNKTECEVILSDGSKDTESEKSKLLSKNKRILG